MSGGDPIGSAPAHRPRRATVRRPHRLTRPSVRAASAGVARHHDRGAVAATRHQRLIMLPRLGFRLLDGAPRTAHPFRRRVVGPVQALDGASTLRPVGLARAALAGGADAGGGGASTGTERCRSRQDLIETWQRLARGEDKA